MHIIDLITTWPKDNPSGFWFGLILPIALAAAALSIKAKRKVVWNNHHWKLFLASFILGVVVLVTHLFYLWPTGLIANGNIAYLAFVNVPTIFWGTLPTLRGDNDVIDPFSTYFIVWATIFIVDILVAFMQPDYIFYPMGIGGDGLKDGLFLFPIFSALFCYFAGLIQTQHFKT
jgi:hypothetical protein